MLKDGTVVWDDEMWVGEAVSDHCCVWRIIEARLGVEFDPEVVALVQVAHDGGLGQSGSSEAGGS